MIEKLKSNFIRFFKEEPIYYINTGGRLEIVGNHTDHNHGLCLVANCSLRIHAAIKPLERNLVRIKSKGFKYFRFYTNKLEETEEDTKTCALCKGVLYRLQELGYKIGGFEAYIDSEIPGGSGVSSSAAIESLFGYIISYLYNDGKIDPLTIAKVGQYSENNYFHKPSGLLDQIGTSFNSSNYIDFKEVENPIIQTIPFNLPLDIYLIKSEGNHAGLTDLYANIPYSMNTVAKLIDNQKYLRDLRDKRNIFTKIDALSIDTHTKQIAKHFFIENDNVRHARIAIENNDVDTFLESVRASQRSSKENLQNTFVEGEYNGSPQAIIDDINSIIGKNDGAIRIHGGGFKGTVIAFIKKEKSMDFRLYLNAKYKGKYYQVDISDNAVELEKY